MDVPSKEIKSCERTRNSLKTLIAGLFGLLFLSFVSPSVIASSLDSTADDRALTPVGLYHHVWQIIKDSFYEPSYNGQRWHRWEHCYDKRIQDLDDARLAVNTMLASLGDRYTRYLDPTAFEQERETIKARLCGIGVQMSLNKEQKLIVIAPIEGTPAARAGILPMDEIVEIDGKPTSGTPVEQASKLIRGEIGTPIGLVILRGGQRIKFSITRDEIPIKSVHEVVMLNNDIGYIRLGTFMSERANDEMRAALDKLSPARGIVIDLRNNPGGLVTNARDICSMFIDGTGVIVSTIDRQGHVESVRASGRPISSQAIVVLINDGSASASEITSGALHDSKRAELVGQKSFGKGLVQSITRLEDGGGINTTIARYVTPNNIDINRKGIIPDFTVELKPEDLQKGSGPWFVYGRDDAGKDRSPADGKDLQLNKALEVLRGKLQFAVAPLEIKLSPTPANQNPFPNSLDSRDIN